jgi:hypothetical protein
MLAGRLASDSVPPMLTASLNICSALRNSGLAADDVGRERGARAGALPLEQTAGQGVLVEVTKVMDLGYLGMVA